MLTLTLTACAASWSQAPTQARSQFVLDFTCPEERVAVSEEPAVPPDEVRADPERLRLWNEQQRDPPVHFERAQGCGHTALYQCSRYGRYSEFIRCGVVGK